jgi:hypothetical protein
MPVRKFRSFDEARRALWVDGSDPTLPDRLRRQWAFAGRLIRHPAPRGVRKFTSIEAANADRDAWVTARVGRLRNERNREG